jgi:hypothetical protein
MSMINSVSTATPHGLVSEKLVRKEAEKATSIYLKLLARQLRVSRSIYIIFS